MQVDINKDATKIASGAADFTARVSSGIIVKVKSLKLENRSHFFLQLMLSESSVVLVVSVCGVLIIQLRLVGCPKNSQFSNPV
jgi:hypothetical protein